VTDNLNDMVCPNCDSDDIEVLTKSSSNTDFMVAVVCISCGARWIDHWCNDDNIQN